MILYQNTDLSNSYMIIFGYESIPQNKKINKKNGGFWV